MCVIYMSIFVFCVCMSGCVHVYIRIGLKLPKSKCQEKAGKGGQPTCGFSMTHSDKDRRRATLATPPGCSPTTETARPSWTGGLGGVVGGATGGAGRAWAWRAVAGRGGAGGCCGSGHAPLPGLQAGWSRWCPADPSGGGGTGQHEGGTR